MVDVSGTEARERWCMVAEQRDGMIVSGCECGWPVTPCAKRPGTTQAFYEDGECVTFTDLVYDGDVVDIFRSAEAAEKGEGWARKMRVRQDSDLWWLETVDG